MAVFELLTLWMFGAMVRDIFSIHIFYSNCRADMDLVNLLEKKFTNFATNVTLHWLETFMILPPQHSVPERCYQRRTKLEKIARLSFYCQRYF